MPYAKGRPARTALVQPARLELPLLDPQLRRDLGIVSAHLLNEPLGVLAEETITV